MRNFFLLLFVSLLFACSPKKVQVEEVALGTNTDQEIVLINIGDGDRSEIANLLLKLEECNPTIVGLDALFLQKGDAKKDSLLIYAILRIEKDVIAFRFDSVGNLERSIQKIRDNASEEGFININKKNGFSDHFTPLINDKGTLYESFPLKVVKSWKPEFKLSVIPNKSVPIMFKKSLKDFHHFEIKNLDESQVKEFLSNKIVLVGYLGPSSEDKHFTPLRSKMALGPETPDTYGVVIIANAIRSLLEYYAE